MNFISKKLLATLILATVSAGSAHASWENMTFKSDIRFRTEMIEIESLDKQLRQRLRARLSLLGKPKEKLSYGFQIATGGTGITSTNATLDGGFANKAIGLDKAWINYRRNENSQLILGKMAIPFVRPLNSPYLWDGDVTPEGMAYKYARTSKDMKYWANLAGLWIDERSSSRDTGLIGAQVGASMKLGADRWINLGLGLLSFINTQGKTPISIKGNSLDANGNYAFDYKVIEGLVEYKAKFKDIPYAVGFNYITNSDADTDNIGYMAAINVGKTKEKGAWNFTYLFRRLEKDSTLGLITDGDLAAGGVDSQGHDIIAKYYMDTDMVTSLSYHSGEAILASPTTITRLRVDLIFWF